MRPIIDEAGDPSQGGAHCAVGRPGNSVDPAHPGPGVPVWQKRYLMDDIVADVLGGGHNIVKTVFLECGAMFKVRSCALWPCAYVGFQSVAAAVPR